MPEPLSGRRVLVVEDQYFIADDIRGLLVDAGASVIGPAASEAEALDRLDDSAPDFALLDINLGDGPIYSIALELRRRGTPFAFVTGYSRDTIAEEFRTSPYIQKPFHSEELVETVERGMRAIGRG